MWILPQFNGLAGSGLNAGPSGLPIPYLTADIAVPYIWTFNTRLADSGAIPNEGDASSSSVLVPGGGPAYASTGGLDGDYVTAASTRFFSSYGGLPEIQGDAGADNSNPWTIAFVFKATKATSGDAVLSFAAHGAFNSDFNLRMSYTNGASSVSINGGSATLSGLVWNDWNVLFVNYSAGTISVALNLGAPTSLGSGQAGSADGSPLKVFSPTSITADAFDDQVDTIAIYTNVANDNKPWTQDRPQIYARIKAKQRLSNLPLPLPPSGDPYHSSVVFLSHFDTSSFVDETGHTVSTSGSPTNPAGLFGNALKVTGGARAFTESSNDWRLPGDFTIEFAVNLAAAIVSGQQAFITNFAGSGHGSPNGTWYIGAYSGGLFLSITGTGNIFVEVTPIPANTTVRYAIVRSGGTGYLFRDGVQVATAAMPSADGGASTVLSFGGDTSGGDPANCWLDEVRLTKGVARYTGSSYTLAAAPFVYP